MSSSYKRDDDNLDPLTGEPGSHPVGTGVGAAIGGAAAGAATGSVAGPVGTVVGAAVGAVVGGLAGKGIAEGVDPTAEDAYWRSNYTDRPYVGEGAAYDDYGPAYNYGVSAYSQYADRDFDAIEPELARNWDGSRRSSNLQWNDARPAVRDAWDRIGQSARGVA